MNDILKIFFSMSLSGSILILVLFLCKPLFKNRISKQWQYYIWLVVIARLLLPFTPEVSLMGMLFGQPGRTAAQTSAFSAPESDMFRIVNSNPTESNGILMPESSLQTNEDLSQPADNLLPAKGNSFQTESSLSSIKESLSQPEDSLPSTKENLSLPESSLPSTEDYSSRTGNYAIQTENADTLAAVPMPDPISAILQYLWLIWIGTALLLLMRKITVYQSFAAYLKAGRKEVSDTERLDQLAQLGTKLGVQRPVELYTNSLISSPLLLGFLHPCIVLPTIDLPTADFQYTVRHELIHYKRLDIFYKWLVQITVCLHWFNPLVWLMEREICRTCELSCDEAVIRALDAQERRAYGDTLLRAMEAGGNYNNHPASVTLSEGAELLKERLKSIMDFKKSNRTVTMLTFVFAAILLSGAVLSGTAAAPISAAATITAGDYATPDSSGTSETERKSAPVITTDTGMISGYDTDTDASAIPGSDAATNADAVPGSGTTANIDPPSKSSAKHESTSTPASQQPSPEQSAHSPVSPDVTADNSNSSMDTLDFRGTTYYLVSNEAQLRAIGTGRYSLHADYMQQADIPLSSEEWIPIGTREHPFTGSYNGNGFEITGLTMTDSDAEIIGLFGAAQNAHIYNITLRDYDITNAGINADERTVSPILALGLGNVRGYDNFAYPKEPENDIPGHNISEPAALAETCYEYDNPSQFAAAFSLLDEKAQETWLEKIYNDGEIAFFTVSLWQLDADAPLIASFANKAYEDGNSSFFSILANHMDKEALESWLDLALQEKRFNFQSILFSALDMDEEADKMEEELVRNRLMEYKDYGITMNGKTYYYQGQLVNIFLDVRADSAFYTLNMNPAGTVNIKVSRDEDGNIESVDYLTEAEANELFGDMED